MAGRTRNIRELRAQAEQADRLAAEAAAAGPPAQAAGAKQAGAKAPAAPRAKKPRKPKVPPRLCARWGVFDGGMRQVATFDYNQRAAAQAKLDELASRNKGLHFLQIVKEPMPEAAPAAAE
jgi:hypothetical protein